MKMNMHGWLTQKEEANLVFKRIYKETLDVFTKRAKLFNGKIKKYFPRAEYQDELAEGKNEPIAIMAKEKLSYFVDMVKDYLDTDISIQQGNSTMPNVELTCSGISFGFFNATSLLQIEKFLQKIKALVSAMETLDITVKWEEDKNEPGVYRSPIKVEYRALDLNVPMTKAAETKSHPAQVEIIQKRVQVGHYEVELLSSLLTTNEKHQILAALEKLLVSVKVALKTANDAKIEEVKVAEQLLDFIFTTVI